MRRVFAFLMTLVLLVSMVPTSVFAEGNVGSGNAEAPYQIGDTVTNDGKEQPAGVTAQNTYWARKDMYDTSVMVCTREVHDHAVTPCTEIPAAVECTKEGHPTDGTLVHTHEDGTACNYDPQQAKWFTIGKAWSCGKEAHAHGDACYKYVNTVWTLKDSTVSERVCEEGCILEGEEEHLENGGECFVWIACTKTEGCEGAEGHDGACYTGIPMVETYTVTLQIRQGSSRVSNVEVKILDANGDVLETVRTSNRGNATIDMPAGEYKAVVDYTSGSYDYKGEAAITVVNRDLTVTVSVEQEVSMSYAESVYERSSYFNHIDVRVQGTYTTGTTVDLTTYNIKLQNVSVVVNNPDERGYSDYNFSFTNGNETYEWRKTNLRIHKDAVVTLTCDIVDSRTSETLKRGFSTSFSGKEDFVQAVRNCDITQGLDFVVNPQEIIEAVFHDVTYVWKVLGTDGSYTTLPAGAPNAPGPHTTIEHGSEYIYDTEYVSGTSFSDYENGLLYTFHGWDTWSHSATYNVDTTAVGYNALDTGESIPLTDDTHIYGYWTVTEMDPTTAHIAFAKKIEGDILADAAALAQAQHMYFRVNPGIDLDGDGVMRVDIDYSMIQAAASGEYKLPVYQYDIPIVVTEYNADIPGYTRTTTIAVEGDHASGDATTGDTVNVSLEEVFTGSDVHLGTVTYTNTYTKNYGEAVSEWPSLNLLKTASDSGASQAGVEFTLYSDAACQDAVATYTTGNNGMLVINFDQVADVTAGSYYLKETKALDGYVADPGVYELILEEEQKVEELRDNLYVQVTYYALDVIVPEDSDAAYTENRATDVYYRLHVLNDPELGSLTLSKDVTGIAPADEDKVAATVIVHGPITRDDSNAITDVGNTWTQILNSSNGWTIELTDLPLGEYLVHESFASVHGYTWSGVTYADANGGNYAIVNHNNINSASVPVESSAAVVVKLTNTYEEWAVADFYIRKIDENGEPLAGATFQLYADEAGTPVTGTGITLSATSGADGYAHFTGYTVPAGQEVVTYYLKETSAPAGYHLDTTIYKVEIKAVTNGDKTTYEPKITAVGAPVEANWNPNTDLLQVTNISIKGTITINKTVVGNPEGLSYVQVQVIGEGYDQIFVLNEENDWSVTVEDLELGTYTITELNASAPGYDYEVKYNEQAKSSVSVELKETAVDVTVSITNTYTRNEEVYENPTSLTVVKVGEDGQTVLPGAEFTLKKMDGNRVVSSVTYTTNAEGKVVFDMLYGSIVNGAPVEGIYHLTETKAPAGYAASDTVWVIKVVEDGNGIRWTLNEKENIFEGFWDWVTGKEDDYIYNDAGALIVKNVELADLTINKFFTDGTDSITPADGVVIEMEVFGADGKLYDTVELTAANGWKATLSDIPAGEYTVTEATGSLHGYTWTGMTAEGYTVTDNSVKIKVENSQALALNVTNTYTKWEAVDFTVFKTADDGKTPLAGATFKLYSDEACQNEVTSTYIDGSNVTDETGIIHFRGFDVDEGETATFYLKETDAPYGYTGTNTVYALTITHDANGYDITCDNAAFNHGSDVLTVINTEMFGKLTITKEVVGLAELEYVRFDITGPNGYSNMVILTAGENWTETLEGLQLGNYTITEQDASVPGYDLAVTYNGQATGTVEVKEENVTTAAVISVTNTYTENVGDPVHNFGSFTVWKVDKNNQPLDGAVFGLYDSEGNLEIQGAPTDDEGMVTFGEFKEAATYTLKEITAPTGYKKTDATWTVTVKEKDGQFEIKLNEEKNVFEHIYDWVVDILTGQEATWNGETMTLTVPNEKLVTVSVEKVWNDDGYHARPENVTVALKRDNTEVATVILNEGNDWTYNWTSYKEGNNTVYLTDAHTWTVEEKSVPAGYTATTTHEGNDWTITNTRATNIIDVTVTKEWELNGDHHEAPESVTVQLLRNGVAYGEKVTLNEENKWTYKWEDLSDAYLWNVSEDEVDGYELKDDIEVKEAINGDLEFTIVNERIINDVEITVTKTWVNGEKDKKVTFPTSVKVTLYQDGKKYDTVTLRASNDWEYTWTGLTDEHEWTIEEKVPSGYIDTYKITTTVRRDGTIEYICAITNTYNSNPKTGDGFDMGFWMMGMTVPVLALFVLFLLGGKKKGKYQT